METEELSDLAAFDDVFGDVVNYCCDNDEVINNKLSQNVTHSPQQNSKPRKKTSSGSSPVVECKLRVRRKFDAAPYADLITSAILSNGDAKLSVAEIYDWMADNVACLNSQRHENSSKGWKNAVRHTLSVNSKFNKISRAGRPSLWTVNGNVNNVNVNPPEFRSHELPDYHSFEPSSDDDDSYFQLEVLRPRSGSEPTYPTSSMSMKRRNTVNTSNVDQHNKERKLTTCGHMETLVEGKQQTIKVYQDDGTSLNVTTDKPIHLKTTNNVDADTQTDANCDEIPVLENAGFMPSCETTKLENADDFAPVFNAELAPSICPNPNDKINGSQLTNEYNFLNDAWQDPLPLDQLSLDTVNDTFTSRWLTDDVMWD